MVCSMVVVRQVYEELAKLVHTSDMHLAQIRETLMDVGAKVPFLWESAARARDVTGRADTS